MGTNDTLRIPRCALVIALGLAVFMMQGCAGGVIEEVGSDGIIDPPGSLCRGLTLASPAEGAFIAQSGVLVKGSITTGEPTTVMVDGIDIQAEGGASEGYVLLLGVEQPFFGGLFVVDLKDGRVYKQDNAGGGG